MDRITLIDKDVSFAAKYAAPSILTERFVANIIDSERSEIESAFQNPGRILVHNMDELWEDKIYEGYASIHEITEQEDGIIVIVDKG